MEFTRLSPKDKCACCNRDGIATFFADVVMKEMEAAIAKGVKERS